jgi:hypothetical protein
MHPAIIIIGIVLIFGLIFLAAYIYEKKRIEAMRVLAAALNFEFSPKKNENFYPEVSHHELFSKGSSPRIKNLMLGHSGEMDIALMEFSYTVGSGKERRTITQTVVRIKSQALNLPSFTLCQESLLHKIGSVFGYKDIDFKEFPFFSKKYLLRGSNEDEIRSFFNQDIIKFFEERMQKKKLKDISVQTDQNDFIYFHGGRRFPVKSLQAFLQEAIDLFYLFKKTSAKIN